MLDIVDAINSINDFLLGISKEQFENNYEKQSAVFRQFEIIGEAASRISPNTKNKYNEINWQDIVGMRHKMIHDYFEVSIDVTWITSKNDLELLKSQIELVIKGNR